MTGLFDSLGMGQVESDPNNIPDGRYPGKVLKSEHVFVEKKSELSHVITYSVTDGKHKGAQRAEWFTIGKDPVFNDDGVLVGLTPTMSETNKQWYKKRLNDLLTPEGTDEEKDKVIAAAMENPESLKDIPVAFGVRRKDGFVNISFAEKRAETAAEQSGGTIASGLL